MANYQSILKKYWGFDNFRGIQKDIIESIGNGRDTLGLMPTGGGKSITFQVPALAQEGVCIVITPLIALMKDQVMHLKMLGIRATAIYSGLSREEIIIRLENAIFGGVKILYVSPERLSSQLFLAKLNHMKVSFVTVDEAHCISQWGYDFRPSYLHIADIRKIKPEAPILALTATATPRVVEDIQKQLQFKEMNVFRMSFERKNLAYIVQHSTDKATDLIQLLNRIEGSAIVYARSRRRTKEFSDFLCDNGFSSPFFHAGLDSTLKDQRQKEWQAGKVRIIVATNAFGMGIDKPDVRLVAHIDCPDSLEAYFQEAGRAGRDGEKSYAVMLYNGSDEAKLKKRIPDTFPEKDYIRNVYEDLAFYYQIGVGSGAGYTAEFDIDKFCHTFCHFPVQVHSALQLLMRSGYIEYAEETENRARVRFLLERDDLYRLENITAKENDLIIALLRNYTGLFSDYNYVDESFLAQQIELNLQQTYFVFMALNKRRILHFIPGSKTPLITYLQRREETEHVIIPHSVYEERKKQYTERIEAVIRYANNNEECRSRQLLAYFGERRSSDCGQCDVCLAKACELPSPDQKGKAAQAILDFLADNQQHHITEILQLSLRPEELDEALHELVNEEKVIVEGSYISLDS